MDQVASNKPQPSAGQAERVIRHTALDRLYHWLMASLRLDPHGDGIPADPRH